jgi:hypothetical protein
VVDVYEALAHHIDALPSGLHVHSGGVEPQTLRQLFSHKEAELALHLTLVPEDPLQIARRAMIAENEAERRLQEMEQRGLIVSVSAEDMHQASGGSTSTI